MAVAPGTTLGLVIYPLGHSCSLSLLPSYIHLLNSFQPVDLVDATDKVYIVKQYIFVFAHAVTIFPAVSVA